MSQEPSTVISVPLDLINSSARVWESKKLDFVLVEEVVEWLEDNDMSVTIEYDQTILGDGMVEYVLAFENDTDAFHFKMRWF